MNKRKQKKRLRKAIKQRNIERTKRAFRNYFVKKGIIDG